MLPRFPTFGRRPAVCRHDQWIERSRAEPVLTLPLTRTDKVGGPFLIRRYEAGDRAALERLYDDFEPKRGAQGLPPKTAPARRHWLDRVLGAGEHLVVEVQGRLLGHAMLIPMTDGGAELANFLHQSIRNRGIGTDLNHIVVALARDRGFRRVWLSVEPSNKAALRSYEKAGFRRRPGSYWAPEVEMEVALEGDAAGP